MEKVETTDPLMMTDLENPRENLISTAVNFLQNPKVRGSHIEQKKLFLEKKGLTKAEVEIAIGRSGVVQSDQGTPYPQGGQLIPITTGSLPSRWSRVRDFTALVIVVGGVGTVLYRFYHYVIKPYWYGDSQKSVELQILEMQQKMVDSLMKVQESLEAIQQSLKSQEDKISQVAVESVSRNVQEDKISQMAVESVSRNVQNANFSQQSYAVTEIKSEISSIKGLLLNRRQFPPTPNTSPVLPAWQRTKTSSPPTILDKPTDTTAEQASEASGQNGVDMCSTQTAENGDSIPTEDEAKETVLPDLSLTESNQVIENKDIEKDDTVSRTPIQNACQNNGILATDDTTLEIAHQ